MKYYMHILLFKCILFGICLTVYPFIHTNFDPCPASAYELSTTTVHTYANSFNFC